jgi:hypothetical protein
MRKDLGRMRKELGVNEKRAWGELGKELGE